MLTMEVVKQFIAKYERRIGLGFLIGGFIFDSFTLRRVDLLFDNLILLAYLAVVALAIVIVNLREGRFVNSKFFAYAANGSTYAMQFAFGGLFSGFIVFYSRSASLITSWPFLLMLAAFFIGNEFFRKRYELLAFHLAVFFIAVFSYSIFSLPVVFKQLGVGIFILSGLVSLAVVMSLINLIRKLAPDRVLSHRKLIFGVIGAIYLIFNIFYFTNIIPPIPLAMKEVGVYHYAERTPNGNYLVFEEEKPWYRVLGRNDLHLEMGEPAYAYSSVFAPTELRSKIFHRWSFFDKEQSQWIESSRIGFPIVGGRDGGYRGFSIKENISAGRWRVDVVTERNQIIGRIKFKVIQSSALPKVEQKLL